MAVSQNKNAGSLHLYRSDHSVRLPVVGKFRAFSGRSGGVLTDTSDPVLRVGVAASLGLEPSKRLRTRGLTVSGIAT